MKKSPVEEKKPVCQNSFRICLEKVSHIIALLFADKYIDNLLSSSELVTERAMARISAIFVEIFFALCAEPIADNVIKNYVGSTQINNWV